VEESSDVRRADRFGRHHRVYDCAFQQLQFSDHDLALVHVALRQLRRSDGGGAWQGAGRHAAGREKGHAREERDRHRGHDPLLTRQPVEQEDPNILIFEDYNKGVLTEPVIQQAISLCRASGVITAVDPKRKNFFSYKGVDIFKPNMKEVQDGLSLLFETSDIYQLRNIHEQLHKQLEHKVSLITLSEKGIFYQQLQNAAIIPSHLRSVADVSGAGDTVIAVAAMVYTVTKNAHMMAEIANIAGGLVCEEVGTAAVDREKLLRECELLLS